MSIWYYFYMSFNSISSHPTSPFEIKENNPQKEKLDRCMSLARDVNFHMARSRLFHGDWDFLTQIQEVTKKAVERQDEQQLEHISRLLAQEKQFILDHLRWLTRWDTWELQAIQIQFGMQQAFIQKAVEAPETIQKENPVSLLQNAHREMNRVFV